MSRKKIFYIILCLFVPLAIGGMIVPVDNYIYTSIELFIGLLLWITFHRWWWKEHADFVRGVKADMSRSEREFKEFWRQQK